MAQLKTPAFVSRLKKSLVANLKATGIDASIKAERVGPTKLFRFQVLAAQFDHMRPTERQELVWNIAERTLTPDEHLLVSMILTLAPKEVAGGVAYRRKAS